MIRVVFDTNVLYSAIFKRMGPEARAFDLVTSGLLLPCVSPPLLAEYREVLFRPALRPHAERAVQVLELFASVAFHVTPTQTLHVSVHEPDNRIYECADAAGAAFIITGNARHFKKSHKNILILNARQLLDFFRASEE